MDLNYEQDQMRARNQRAETRLCHSFAQPGAETEPHYSFREVSEMWGYSVDTIKKIFANEPGVLRHEKPATRGCRGYVSIRIPHSVLLRVYARMTTVQ
jgi:hypothetical protein